MNRNFMFALGGAIAFGVSYGCAGGGAEATRGVSLKPCASPAVSLATQLKIESRPTVSGLPPAGPINVYFHVINNGPETVDGNIPQQWIDDQMDVLNAAYGSHGYVFNLVVVDRWTDADWFNMGPNSPAEAAAKAQLKQGTAVDLNIYTANLNVRGWASYPWDYASNPSNDGVVVYFNSLPGSMVEPFHLGDTLVHEVGHWLGLYHTYENGCNRRRGDKVSDTPAEDVAAFGCPIGRDTCTKEGLDPVENYMDETDDSCANNFTAGQKERMDSMWTEFRNGN